MCQRCGALGTVLQASALEPTNGATVGPLTSTRLSELQEAPSLLPTGLELFDRALGGYAAGSTVFIAGEPGAGKTTFALKLADSIGSALIASSEESAGPVRAAADALGIYESARNRDVFFLYESELTKILEEAERLKPTLLVVNSVNRTHVRGTWGRPGSSEQIKALGEKIIAWTALRATMTLLIGHVTWEGRSQGPRTLEHDVDAVLYLTIAGGRRRLEVHKTRPPLRGALETYTMPDWAAEGPGDSTGA
jgi:DNA repair protein RadA/Sms